MILAIDPGPERSAYCGLDDADYPTGFGIISNRELLGIVTGYPSQVVIEMIASYGMPVGAEVFATCRWIGRFQQATRNPESVRFVFRKQVTTNLCGSARAKDSNVRQAIIDRYGGPAATKKGGCLYGISKDVWAALAVGLTYLDQQKIGGKL